MTNRTRITLYLLYVGAAVSVSLYARFPSDSIREYAVRQVEVLAPGIALAVSEVRPGLPAAVRFQGVEAAYQGTPVLRLEQCRLTPSWGSLLGMDSSYAFRATLGGGVLRGKVQPPGDSPDAQPFFRTEFEDIDLEKLPILSELFGRRLAGRFSGTVSRTETPSPEAIEIRLEGKDAAVGVQLPMLRREEFSFQRVEAEADVSNAVVRLRRCAFSGPELDGELAGTFHFGNDLGTSGIQLNGTVKPHTVFLAELKKAVPQQIMPSQGAEGSIDIRLSGTLQHPEISFR